MIKSLCTWTDNKNGKIICATVATVGGLHLLATPPQKVLGFLPSFSFEIGWPRNGRTTRLLARLLTLCGLCGLGACCL